MAEQVKTVDEQLLALQARDGDRQAFSVLVEHFTPRLRSFLIRRMSDRCDVEDAIQETFLKVHLNICSYDQRYRFSCWLFTIASRTAINLTRTRRPAVGGSLEDFDAGYPTPYENACRSDAKRNIWDIAATLEPKQYMAVYLKYSEDFTTEEIAAAMDTSRINVRVLLHRARGVLMNKLREYEKQGV